MINAVEAVSKQNLDFSGLQRDRLIKIFERQIEGREGGNFSSLHAFNSNFLYATPLIFMGVVAAVVFFPITAISLSIAFVVLGIAGVRIAITLFDRNEHKAKLKLCITELKNKYQELGVIEERDLKEMVAFTDAIALDEMIKSMNNSQRTAAYAAAPLRVKPLLMKHGEWIALFNEQDEEKKGPMLARVLEIEGKKSFELPDVSEEWDELMTEQLDRYYATHTDLYSLNQLMEVLEKHPDCEELKSKVAINLMSLNLNSSFFDWKKLWDMAKILAVQEVTGKMIALMQLKFAKELISPSQEFKELYIRLEEAKSLPPCRISIKNIRLLYELGPARIKQAVLHFIKINTQSVADSNVWEFDEMPEPIKKIIYPEKVKRYY